MNFFFSGLKLQGATCANNKLSLSTSISTELPLTQLRWIKQSNAEKRHMVTPPPKKEKQPHWDLKS